MKLKTQKWKTMRFLFLTLVGAWLFVLPQAAQATHTEAIYYCWCRKPDSTCESRSHLTGDTPIVQCSSGASSCQTYCTSRSWTIAYCDTDRWVDRAASGECPTSRPESSSPTTTSTSETTTSTGGVGVSGEIRLFNPLGADTTIPQFIGKMARAVVGVVGAIALLMFVYGGILWMTAGSGERVKTAKEIIKNSLIGILLIFLSYSIISFFFSLFG